MLIINLFGGPGSGKSTMSANIFSLLKFEGVNCELVTEYAKEKAWEGVHPGPQEYIFGMQLKRISRLVGKVDVIVTDSPLLLSLIYCDFSGDRAMHFKSLILDSHKQYKSFNVFIKRSKPYNPAGRYQNEEQAEIIDGKIFDMLNDNKIDHYQAHCNKYYCENIVRDVIDWWLK